MLKVYSTGICVVAVISVVVIAVSMFHIVRVQKGYADSKKEYENLKGAVIETAPLPTEDENQLLNIDYEKLSAINVDFKFWIEIPETAISYPVVQSTDNDCYLRRTFEGQSNVGGVIFVDYRCADDLAGRNTLIYGHRMNDGSMFGELGKYMDKTFLEEHPYIYLYKSSGTYAYRVFSVSRVDTACDCFTLYFEDNVSFGEWLTKQKERSVIDTDVIPDAEDKVITLVSCTGQEEQRYIVQAVLFEAIPLRLQ